jgi:hypothetical protein
MPVAGVQGRRVAPARHGVLYVRPGSEHALASAAARSALARTNATSAPCKSADHLRARSSSPAARASLRLRSRVRVHSARPCRHSWARWASACSRQKRAPRCPSTAGRSQRPAEHAYAFRPPPPLRPSPLRPSPRASGLRSSPGPEAGLALAAPPSPEAALRSPQAKHRGPGLPRESLAGSPSAAWETHRSPAEHRRVVRPGCGGMPPSPLSSPSGPMQPRPASRRTPSPWPTSPRSGSAGTRFAIRYT